MTDPCTLITCPCCKGSGRIGESCPYSHDVEVDCESCAIDCSTDGICEYCEGYGDVADNIVGRIIKELSYNE